MRNGVSRVVARPENSPVKSKDAALGAPGATGCNGRGFAKHTRCHADAFKNGGASLRDIKEMDGALPLPDEAAQKRANGDEPACAGVKPPTNDQPYGSHAADRGHTSLRVRLARFLCRHRGRPGVETSRETNVAGSYFLCRVAAFDTERLWQHRAAPFLRLKLQ